MSGAAKIGILASKSGQKEVFWTPKTAQEL